MRLKRVFSSALAAATLAGSVMAAPASAVGQSSFSDLSAPAVIEATEFLRLLGVVNGLPGGTYNPSGTLSRAEFCKMAVVALDRADEEPAQRGRTIYLDVGPTHWARGYINLCSVVTLGGSSDGSGGVPLVSGVGDGTFQPDRPITYGEAVTILCRILGYGVNDVATGGAWYDGYLAAAHANGLTDGLSLGGGDTIDRASAAILFYNLYFTETKGSNKTYLVSLGGSEEEGGVILDTDATADDGTTGAVSTTKGTYKSDRTFDPSLEGQEGTVLLDADGKLLAFQPKKGTSSRVVNITGAEATYLIASGGEKLEVEPDTVAYKDGKSTTWSAIYADLNTSGSAAVTLHYGANGKLSYLFLSGQSAESVTSMVARTTPNGTANPFSSMAGGSNYTMFKNGIAATAADIRQYDVATYNAATRTIQVSDVKLTGVYEDASPSPKAPVTITVMGHTFDVLSSARNDIAAFKVGDRITLLLTTENQVAGVVSANTVRGDAVGIATVSGTTATVKLLQGGLSVSGTVSSGTADRCNNQLVTVTSSTAGKLSLQTVTGSTVKGTLDTAARTLGDRTVAENVVVYDRVKDGIAVKVDYNKLPATISRDKISFVSYDYAGRVKYLVLNDATGDAYQYGYFGYKVTTESGGSLNGEDGTYEVRTVWIRQGGADGGKEDTIVNEAQTLFSVRSGTAGGLALTADGKAAGIVYLQSLTGVARSAFDVSDMTVTVAGVSYPISDVVQCYNKTTKTWFKPGKEGLESARAYSDDLTVYYDRAPGDGGKIRLIVVE
mgnify:CR=1 FL=1